MVGPVTLTRVGSSMSAVGQAGVHGLGVPAAVLLLVPMEAGLPVPIPSDLVMLVVGERVAAGAFPLWSAVVAFEMVAIARTTLLFLACRGPGHALITRVGPRVGLTDERLARATALVARRGRPALAVGRGTPGLRTVTVVAAGGSGMNLRRALPALVVGSSVFLQLHLFLGFFLGSAARHVLDQARGPALTVLALLVVGGIGFWLVRRGRRAGGQAFREACCPACLALGLLSEHQPIVAELT